MSLSPLAGIVVEPNPIQEGGEVTVSYDGSGSLYYNVDGAGWVKLPVDADGNATISAPTGSGVIVISDRDYPNPTEVLVEVVSTGS